MVVNVYSYKKIRGIGQFYCISCLLFKKNVFLCINKYKKKEMGKEQNKLAHFFIKFGKREHMDKLLREGEVFLNTSQFYRDCKNPEVGDSNEGLIQQPLPDIIKIDGVGCCGVNIHERFYVNKNLYCLYCIENEDIKNALNEKNQYEFDLTGFNGFGDCCVVFHYLEPFVNKIKEAIEKEDLKLLGCKLVRYEDFDSYPGKIGHFMKDKKFSHQREFRFVIDSDEARQRKIYLGNLEEYAKIVPINNNKLIVDFELVKTNN